MSILERLEQMERRMAEMSGQQQQQGSGGTSESGVTGGGGGGGGEGRGNADQTQVCIVTLSSFIRWLVTWIYSTALLNSRL